MELLYWSDDLSVKLTVGGLNTLESARRVYIGLRAIWGLSQAEHHSRCGMVFDEDKLLGMIEYDGTISIVCNGKLVPVPGALPRPIRAKLGKTAPAFESTAPRGWASVEGGGK